VNRTAVVRCVVAAVLFGASAPAASELAGHTDAFTLGGLLYVGAALAVVPATLYRPPTLRSLQRGGGQLATAVIVGGAVAPVLLAAGLARTPAATASLLLNLELMATVLLAAAVFHEHIGSRVAFGTALVVARGGRACLVVVPGTALWRAARRRGVLLLGG
jgi:drug/metabolite transporter (DMT)-like permease